MTDKRSLNYRDAGVLDNSQLGLRALLKWVNKTHAFRPNVGKRVIDVGFFASIVDIGNRQGLVLCTDGVGSKVLIAEMMEKYDTIGIDCVAMNVNDAICVGAEPISFLDYIAIERATPDILDQIGRGLFEGAKQAGVNIVGGEISQIPDIIKGDHPGSGLDLVGMCAAIVSLDHYIVGQDVQPGDAIIGVRSSGVHSNGLTLARRALFDEAGLKRDEHVSELGCTIGEELLKPTHIYVAPVMDLLRKGLPIRALVNITSDGFLNLARIEAKVGFEISHLPKPPAIFDIIRTAGSIKATEMYRVFNMGIGFCVIAPNDPKTLRAIDRSFASKGFATTVIGRVIRDSRKRVSLPGEGLVGEGDEFCVTDFKA